MRDLYVNETVTLRLLKTEDAQSLYEQVCASQEHLFPFMPWVGNYTSAAAAQKFIEQKLKDLERQKGLAMGIFLNQNLIGVIGIERWDHYLKVAEIGYWLTKTETNKGIMFKALKTFLGHIFHTLKLEKVEIRCLPENERSIYLAKKLGARQEGVLRHAFKINGQVNALVVLGILKSEWTDD